MAGDTEDLKCEISPLVSYDGEESATGREQWAASSFFWHSFFANGGWSEFAYIEHIEYMCANDRKLVTSSHNDFFDHN